jgi:ABC-type sugar transport system ATPase subunit
MEPAMAGVKYVGASRVYAKGVAPAVDMLDLDIKDGEFMVLVGPSGSGKTTALRMLAGLEPLDGGRIEIAGRDISDVQPKDRDIAMVFQNYALYPSKTVAENMGFALKMQHVPRDERDRRVREAARILDLDEGLLDRKPKQLSGGKLQQCASPRELYDNPVNQFVAGFIGSPAMNLLMASLTSSGASLAGADIPLSPAVRAAATRDKLTELVIGIRPEHLHVIGPEAGAGADAAALTGIRLDGEVLLVEELGADALLHVRLTGDAGPVAGSPAIGSPVAGRTVVARTEGRKSPAPGQRVAFRAQPDNIFAFHPATGARLAG